MQAFFKRFCKTAFLILPYAWVLFCNFTLGRKKLEVAILKQYATNVIQWQDITISAIAGKERGRNYCTLCTLQSAGCPQCIGRGINLKGRGKSHNHHRCNSFLCKVWVIIIRTTLKFFIFARLLWPKYRSLWELMAIKWKRRISSIHWYLLLKNPAKGSRTAAGQSQAVF